MSKNKYKNPWYDGTSTYGPDYYENDGIKIGTYRGFDVYEVQGKYGSTHDYVFKGMCVTQRDPNTDHVYVVDTMLSALKFVPPVARGWMEKHKAYDD